MLPHSTNQICRRSGIEPVTAIRDDVHKRCVAQLSLRHSRSLAALGII
jgi:hypothetical protein